MTTPREDNFTNTVDAAAYYERHRAKAAGEFDDYYDRPSLRDETEPVPCPECAAGKHLNCDGTAWDNHVDTIGPCPCYEAGHPDE